MAPLRNSLPEQSQSESSIKTPRKSHYVHKANTIGIPSESDLSDSKNQSPRKGRTIFDGFRNTLRNKHKSDSVVLEAAKENEKNDLHRRWSENNHSTVSNV